MKKGEEWRGDSPFGLRRFGGEFITVGRDALEACTRRDPPTLLEKCSSLVVPDPIYYNFLHGVELGLKSYLRHVDAVTLQVLRRPPFGHDLTRLLDKALDHSLRHECPELTDTHLKAIYGSNEIYASKRFEYIHIGFGSLVGIDQVAEAAETLIAGLKKLPMKPAQDPGQ